MKNLKFIKLDKKIIIILFIFVFSAFYVEIAFSQSQNNKNIQNDLRKTLSQNPKIIQYYDELMEKDPDNALFIAVNSDNLDLVKKALQINKNVDVRDNDDRTPLMTACRKENANIVNYLLKKGADVEAKDSQGNTALMYAATFRHFDLIKLLLEKGANINTVNKQGATVLTTVAFYSAYHPNADIDAYNIINFLIDKGINSKSAGVCETAFRSLVQHNNINSAKLILEKNPNTNINQADSYGNSILNSALSSRVNIDTIKFLLDNGADINLKNIRGLSPILNAAQSYSKDVIEFMVSKGANIHEKGPTGDNILMYAVNNPNLKDLLPYFANNGIEMNSVNNLGKNQIMSAVKNAARGTRDQDLSRIKLLLDNGSDINSKDDQGKTLIIIAAEVSPGFSPERVFNSSLIDFLVKKGVDVNAKDKDGKTALMYAANNDNYPVVKSLLKAGANVNYKDMDGKTALIYSAGNSTSDILIDYGANVNAQDNNGKTALMYASINTYINTERLIKNHANINIKDNLGKTAADYSNEKAKLYIVNLLKKPNAIQNLSRDQLPCDIDDEVHYVSAAGGKANVHISVKNKPIVLILSSYNAVEWNITQAPGSKIKKAIIHGYYAQTYKGLSPNIPVINLSFTNDQNEYLSFDNVIEDRNRCAKLKDQIEHKLGVRPKTMQEAYGKNFVEVNGINTVNLSSSDFKNANKPAKFECRSDSLKDRCSLSDDRLTITTGAATTARAYHAGKWYLELSFHTKAIEVGRHDARAGLTLSALKYDFPQFMNYDVTGENLVKKLSNGDTLGLALDLDNNKLFVLQNGVWLNGNPDNKKLGLCLGKESEYWVGAYVKDNNYSWTANFGDKTFKYPIPTGYKPFNGK